MRDNRGFLLVEFLMEGLTVTGFLLVIAMIGIQSAIAVSRLSTTREQAHIEAMKRDLENLAARQAIHLSDAGAYASSLASLGFAPTPGVRVSIAAWEAGWSGVATHAGLDDDQACTVVVSLEGDSEVGAGGGRSRLSCTAQVADAP